MADSPRTAAPHAGPRWAAPYITRRQLIATGLASRSTLAREHERGALIPFGRRGGRGPVVYLVSAVEAWLRGDVPGIGTTARPAPPGVLRRRSASADTAAALARLDEIARGGRR